MNDNRDPINEADREHVAEVHIPVNKELQAFDDYVDVDMVKDIFDDLSDEEVDRFITHMRRVIANKLPSDKFYAKAEIGAWFDAVITPEAQSRAEAMQEDE